MRWLYSNKRNHHIDNKRFTSLVDRIVLQIFRVNSNVKGIESLVKQLGGRNDNSDLRNKLSVAI